jgi:hypothetical protein
MSGRLRAAIAALGTRITFLVVAWLMLSRSAKLIDVAIVAGAQLVSYLIFRQLAQRLRPMTAPADLLSVAALATMSFYLSNLLVLASLVAGLSLLRAFGDRSPEPFDFPDEKATRDTLARLSLFVVGAGIGAAALWFGPIGALWANAMVFAVAAVLGTIAMTPKALPVIVEPSVVDGPVLEAATSLRGAVDGSMNGGVGAHAVIDAEPAGALPSGPLVRRLAFTLFATNLFAQAGAALLIVHWTMHIAQTPELLGLVATAFILGLLGGGLTFSGLTRGPGTSIAIALGCLAGGAGAYLYLLDRPPALLLVVVAALLTGVATASVAPITGTLLADHVPASLRSKVDGALASTSYLGFPVGTVAAAWYLPRATALTGLGAAAGAYVVAVLIPVFVNRSWRKMFPEPPVVIGMSSSRLPARLTVTLAYANGQWIVEVRRGRALLGSRHLVKSADAMNMLAVLEVPGVQDSVEKALTVDQVEASRQADRMRMELAELEARLAGLTEMVEITENQRAPRQRGTNGSGPKEEEVAK